MLSTSAVDFETQRALRTTKVPRSIALMTRTHYEWGFELSCAPVMSHQDVLCDFFVVLVIFVFQTMSPR